MPLNTTRAIRDCADTQLLWILFHLLGCGEWPYLYRKIHKSKSSTSDYSTTVKHGEHGIQYARGLSYDHLWLMAAIPCFPPSFINVEIVVSRSPSP
jgi:hypothetical protein